MGNFTWSDFSIEHFGSIDVAQKVMGGKNFAQYVMTVEAALARVQAEIGMIPQDAADEITKKCDVELINADEYSQQLEITGGQVMVALIRAYNSICDNNLGQYIHYGTTSQDITDTSVVLMQRDAYEIILKKSKQLLEVLCEKAKKYRSLVMMGRTNDQQALPITLGFKFASWADEMERSIERMEAAKERMFVGQFHGAVGTLASLGEDGIIVRDNLMRELGLGIPKMAWYSARDRFAEYVFQLSCLTCTLGRFGNEIYINNKSEVNELAQGFKAGNVGSSTMPHKRNPFVSARLAAYGRYARTTTADALMLMESTNERDVRTLSVEYHAIERAAELADASLDIAIPLISNMEVHEVNIKKNLDLLGGLVFSEAVMMRLSKTFGRLEAHEMMYEHAQKAIEENLVFKDLLLSDSRITSQIPVEELEEIMKNEKYIGLSEYFVDVVAGK